MIARAPFGTRALAPIKARLPGLSPLREDAFARVSGGLHHMGDNKMIKLWISTLALICVPALASTQPAPIRIGVVGPFSGAHAQDVGESIRGGARVFADEVNRMGLLLGRRIELVERDSGGSVEQSEKLARELVEQERVVAVVGFDCPERAARAAPVLQQARTPLILSVTGSGELQQLGRVREGEPSFIFRVAGNEALQTEAMLRDLVDRRQLKAVAVLHADTPEGEASKARALAALQTRGVKPVAVESFKPGSGRLARAMFRIKAAEADGIAIYADAADAAAAVREIGKYKKWTPALAGTWALSQQSFIEAAGEAAEGVRSAVTFIEGEWRGPRRDFATAYRKLNQVQAIPSPVAAAQTYDALRLLYLAIFQANSVAGERIQVALDNLELSARSTVATRYTKPFSPRDHEAIGPGMVAMAEIRNGRLAYAWPEDEAVIIQLVKR